jgi:hypothetical protein
MLITTFVCDVVSSKQIHKVIFELIHLDYIFFLVFCTKIYRRMKRIFHKYVLMCLYVYMYVVVLCFFVVFFVLLL